MPRLPSDKTITANLRRENNRLRKEVTTTRAAAESYRVRATRAEQEVSDWKRRFDALLERRAAALSPTDSR
jgi:FtsZ-binding cell division protein ZapB